MKLIVSVTNYAWADQHVVVIARGRSFTEQHRDMMAGAADQVAGLGGKAEVPAQ